jgi:hypothetical protein
VGVWVSSVQSGSPADKAGIKGGDIITTLENLVVATDGTMSDYCDIIRSHNSEDPLNVEVVRFSTGEVLQGQLNGRELAVVGMLNTTADTGGDTGGNTGGDTGGDTTASGTWNPDASASGDFYYQSEFDNTLTDWAYFLMSGKDSGGTSEITDGKLRVELSDQNTWLYFYLDPLDVADVRLDTKVENLGKNNNNVSLFCRYDPDRGWYEFNVANNGEYTIFYYDMLEKTYLALYTGASRDIQMGKSINVITAVCQGNELTLAVNGSILRTVEDNRLSSGKVGLSVSSFNVTPIVVEFDYFYASVP